MSTQIAYGEAVKREIRQMVQVRGVEETLNCIREAEEEISSEDEKDEEFNVDDIPTSCTPRWNEIRVDSSGICWHRGEFVRAEDVIDKDEPWWSEEHGSIDRDDVRLKDGGLAVEIVVDENEG